MSKSAISLLTRRKCPPANFGLIKKQNRNSEWWEERRKVLRSADAPAVHKLERRSPGLFVCHFERGRREETHFSLRLESPGRLHCASAGDAGEIWTSPRKFAHACVFLIANKAPPSPPRGVTERERRLLLRGGGGETFTEVGEAVTSPGLGP